MEYFEVYNQKGEPLNKVVTRGTKLNPGEFFLVVHVWIKNASNEYLIQQRAKSTDPIPYQWATTTGLPNVGETLIDAAIRETKEEIGISIDANNLKRINEITTVQSKYKTITHVYLYRKDIDIRTLKLDSSEVKKVKYLPLKAILKMVENGQFWNYAKLLDYPDYFKTLESW